MIPVSKRDSSTAAGGRRRAAACLAAAALVAGCAVGPSYRRPPLDTAAGYGPGPVSPATASPDNVPSGEAQRFVAGADIPARWWELYESPALDELIAQALKRNPDLKAAQAALRVAMQTLAAQRGALLPSITAGAAASRNQNASEPSPFLASNVLLYNLYQAQLNATWTLDLWGQNRRAVEAQKAQAEAQRYQLESVYLALTANVVAAAVQEASLRGQLAAAETAVGDGREAMAIARREYALGQISGSDVAAQEAAQAQLEQTLPPLRRQWAQERDLLAALSGRLPNDAVPTVDLAGLRLPREVPVSLPSKLVEQRPDIRIAEANLHAACAQVGVAVANQLPNLTLTGDIGPLATQTEHLFGPGNYAWGAGAGIAQPIFQGGALWHRTQAARAAYDQAAAQYRSAVVTAFQNVADSLHALASDSDLVRAASAADSASADGLAIARRQCELGGIAYPAVLAAEQAREQARIALIQARAGRLADTAALFQALGGGWWNRPNGGAAGTAR